MARSRSSDGRVSSRRCDPRTATSSLADCLLSFFLTFSSLLFSSLLFVIFSILPPHPMLHLFERLGDGAKTMHAFISARGLYTHPPPICHARTSTGLERWCQ